MPLVTMQVTIGAAPTRFQTASRVCKQVLVQNNAAHDIRIGAANTTSTIGMVLKASSVGSANLGAFIFQSVDLNELWVAGTQNDVIDVFYVY